jgi:predicted ATP-grasp superfamily ATP-dependent carboligase
MKHFLFEFITGGGLIGQTLPDSLVREARTMVQTLIKELIACGHYKITITRDSRSELFDYDVTQHTINTPFKKILPKLVRKSDVCWLIAPETENCLYNLTDLFMKNASIFIGSDLNAVHTTASKLITSNILENANICTPETKLLKDVIPDSKSGWIIKPDDGVGAQNCIYVSDRLALREDMTIKENNNYIIQPFIEGEHMSMSLFVYNKNIQLLSCNKQEITLKNNLISLTGIGVNEFLLYKDQMKELAESIVSTIPGFSGYIGIDLIRSNNKFFVIDINPRFTTSYAGISASLGINITEKILNTFLSQEIQDINLKKAIPIKLKF